MLSRLGQCAEPTALKCSALHLQKVGEGDLCSHLPLHHYPHFSPNSQCWQRNGEGREGRNNLLAPSTFQVANVHAGSELGGLNLRLETTEK